MKKRFLAIILTVSMVFTLSSVFTAFAVTLEEMEADLAQLQSEIAGKKAEYAAKETLYLAACTAYGTAAAAWDTAEQTMKDADVAYVAAVKDYEDGLITYAELQAIYAAFEAAVAAAGDARDDASAKANIQKGLADELDELITVILGLELAANALVDDINEEIRKANQEALEEFAQDTIDYLKAWGDYLEYVARTTQQYVSDTIAYNLANAKYQRELRAYNAWLAANPNYDAEKAAWDKYVQDKAVYDAIEADFIGGTKTNELDGIIKSYPAGGYVNVQLDPNGNTLKSFLSGNNQNATLMTGVVLSRTTGQNAGVKLTISSGLSGYMATGLHVNNTATGYIIIDLSKAGVYDMVPLNQFGYGIYIEPTEVRNPGPKQFPPAPIGDKPVLVIDDFEGQHPEHPELRSKVIFVDGEYVEVWWANYEGQLIERALREEIVVPPVDPDPDPDPDPSPEPVDPTPVAPPIVPPPFVPTVVIVDDGDDDEGEDAGEADDEEVDIDEIITPLANTIDDGGEAVVLVEEIETPLVNIGGTSGNSWHLWNLILSICGIVLALAMGIRAVAGNKKEEEADQEHSERRKNLLLGLAIPAAAIAACIVFILTQDMTAPMAMVDKWTALHAGLFATGMLSFIFADRKVEKTESVTA